MLAREPTRDHSTVDRPSGSSHVVQRDSRVTGRAVQVTHRHSVSVRGVPEELERALQSLQGGKSRAAEHAVSGLHGPTLAPA